MTCLEPIKISEKVIKQKNPNNKSYIYIYTLNGILVETSSEPSHIINIEPMKNGKIFFNTI